ncbi:MAG: hypothetical protein JST11_08330 [Acidobacteria bacterium]|nr:hypothetical protein [Acidobacteriota bacterium]
MGAGPRAASWPQRLFVLLLLLLGMLISVTVIRVIDPAAEPRAEAGRTPGK